MINNVVSFPQLPEVTQIKPVADQSKEIESVSPASESKDSQDSTDFSHRQDQSAPPEYALRLTVDKDPNTGDWVYKAINRYTGEVVRQLPRQELLDMKRSGQYRAGSVIKTDV